MFGSNVAIINLEQQPAQWVSRLDLPSRAHTHRVSMHVSQFACCANRPLSAAISHSLASCSPGHGTCERAVFAVGRPSNGNFAKNISIYLLKCETNAIISVCLPPCLVARELFIYISLIETRISLVISRVKVRFFVVAASNTEWRLLEMISGCVVPAHRFSFIWYAKFCRRVAGRKPNQIRNYKVQIIIFPLPPQRSAMAQPWPYI